MPFLPLFLNVTSQPVALVGTGPAAIGKIGLLRSLGATVCWFTEGADVSVEVVILSALAGGLQIDVRDPLTVRFDEFAAVVIAHGDARDDAVARYARTLTALVNVVDRADLSNFIIPAIVNRGEVVVAIGTGGASPVLARRLREQIEAILPARIGDLAALLGRYRERFAVARHSTRSLRRFWERVIDGPIGRAALTGRWRDAEAKLVRAIDEARSPEEKSGAIFLVGAGPGDPDLLTLRALHALQNADVVLYDELVTPEILTRCRREAELVFVGKRKGEPGIGQSEINRQLAHSASSGKTVVRLKGGDPLIFGRGGEELEHLRNAGIPTFVVPGVTAALGCAAEVGLPLTFRKETSRLTFVTANTADDAETVDWSGLCDRQTTVVVYMGLSSAAIVRDGLIAAGRDPQTPAVVLARGTRPDAKAVVGRLDGLPALAAAVGEGPALLVIGEIVARSEPWRSSQLLPAEVAA
jgi:uroporphyrin-III C-methyltransferase/precorrin-2 dehydrogenase/sirohydrochlorin ferrochelatase